MSQDIYPAHKQTKTQNMNKKVPSKKAKQSKKRTKYVVHLWRLILVGLVATFIVLGGFFIWVATLEIPELGNFADRDIRQSTKIYDRTGEVLLYDVFKEERRTVVDISEISDNVKKAVLATEDDEFYNHNGVRFTALIRSIVQKIQNPDSRLGGGSTITQQVIKNAILTSDRRVERKVKEWVLAWRLEGQLSKDEILAAYLNEIAFGGSVYGVEQAARSFFGISASEVSIAQSAYIAAVPKAPTFYSPFGSNKDRLEGRKNYILGRMRDLGYISQDQYETARAETVEFVARENRGIKAPHFVFYIVEQLEQEYGNDMVERGGLRVITTLDWELQQELETITTEYSERLPEFGASNLATVAVDVQDGNILSMVGSKDYFADDIDGNFNIATAQRQPGSTFKPFVYSLAFERGYTPQTMLWDATTEFSSSCFPDGTSKFQTGTEGCYTPQNYDSRARGPISMQSALAQSLNIPAVKALYLVGVGDAISWSQKLGITGLNRSASFYGLNLVLGGGEVRLIDMASAYAVFGNDGKRNELASILRVTNRDGEILSRFEKNEQQVMSTNVARMVSQILSDDDLKRPMFGARSVLYHDDIDVAVKTGTTNSFRDTWTVGYTNAVSVGVWIGNNDNTKMANKPSSTVAAPYWRMAMDAARIRYPGSAFTDPTYPDPSTLPPVLAGSWQGDQSYTVVVPDIDEEGELISAEETRFLPAYHSVLHWVDKRDPQSGGNSRGDSLYENWETAVRDYAISAGYETAIEPGENGEEPIDGENNGGEGTTTSPTIPEQTSVDFFFTAPFEGSVLDINRRQSIEIILEGPSEDVDRIFYYVNNTYLGSGAANETSASFTPSSIRNIENTNTIKVIVQLENGDKIERRMVFGVQ